MPRRIAWICCLTLVFCAGSLLAEVPTAAELAALREAIFLPAPVYAQTQIVTGGEDDSTCTLYHTCDDGTQISCSSATGNCHSYSTYIVCDGIRKDCPPPPTSQACRDLYVQCPNGLYMACPSGSQECEPWSRYCLMCDGVIKRCSGVTCPL
jgi:hypothetical protein